MSGRYVGYTRVSSPTQIKSGSGISRQEMLISRFASANDFEVLFMSEGFSKGDTSPSNRPVLKAALNLLGHGFYRGLVVESLDRLTRSVDHWNELEATASSQGWEILVANAGPSFDPQLAVATAENELQQLRWRTRETLAMKKQQGVHIGRPNTLPEHTRIRIFRMRIGGATLTAIANQLNAEGVPTAHGGRCWYPATIKRLLETPTPPVISAQGQLPLLSQEVVR